MPEHETLLQEVYRLSLENNRLLHKMRRQAFWGRVVTLVFYLALLIAPIWLYQQYLAGTVQNLMQQYGFAQGATTTPSQYQQIEDALKTLETRLLTVPTTTGAH